MSTKPEQYVRQSIVVEALQLPYEGEWDEDEICEFIQDDFVGICSLSGYPNGGYLNGGRRVILATSSGFDVAYAGNWLVKDPQALWIEIVDEHLFSEKFKPAHEALQGLGVDDYRSHAQALQDRIDILERQNGELRETVGGLVDSIFNLVDGPAFQERRVDREPSTEPTGTRILLSDNSPVSSDFCHCCQP